MRCQRQFETDIAEEMELEKRQKLIDEAASVSLFFFWFCK